MAEGQNSLLDRLREFIQTPRGRVIVVAAAGGVFLLALLIVFAVIITSGGPSAKKVDSVATKPAGGESSPTASVANTDSAADERATDSVNASFEVYQTRDPFKPVPETISVTTATVSSGSTTQTVSSSTAGSQTSTPAALSLQSITNRDGVNYAVIKYGDSTYELKAGDRVGDSPYQVVQVGTDSVTLLYGDDQFNLQVGQEVYK